MERGRVFVVCAVGILAAGTSSLIAFRSGADVGRSGGPAGYAFAVGNCTACHEVDPALYPGPGGVEIVGAPRRYRAGGAYDLTIRVFDAEQSGAGFEISAENADGHQGAFVITNPHTQNAGSSEPIQYVTHTRDGANASFTSWEAGGGSFAFQTRWLAPIEDVGPVTLFAAGNAVDGVSIGSDRYYSAHATMVFARTGDGDGDNDADLKDVALLQRCFGVSVETGDACAAADFDADGLVFDGDTAETVGALEGVYGGPVSTVPPGYVAADAARGGTLYDRWWTVIGAPAPEGEHPLYPEIGQQTGGATFRCKECHGWDYKGVDGAYGSGSHFTGIAGVWGTTLTPQAMFDLLVASPDEMPNGHDMDAYGMGEQDVWDVVKMVLEGTVDTDLYIDTTTPEVFISTNAGLGSFYYQNVCSSCHDDSSTGAGTLLNFGDDINPVYVGTVANGNPWEFLHKVRFGDPGTSMPALELLRWDVDRAAAIGAFSVTLPTE